MAEETTLAWRAIKPGHRVLDSDGMEFGTVARVLADDKADIFHGIAVKRQRLGPELEVTADRIHRIEKTAVHTSISASEAGR
jgi:hypothetical protein